MNENKMDDTGLETALRTLLKQARKKGISPVENGFWGLQGLSDDERLLLALMDYLPPSELPPEKPEGAADDGPTSGQTPSLKEDRREKIHAAEEDDKPSRKSDLTDELMRKPVDSKPAGIQTNEADKSTSKTTSDPVGEEIASPSETSSVPSETASTIPESEILNADPSEGVVEEGPTSAQESGFKEDRSKATRLSEEEYKLGPDSNLTVESTPEPTDPDPAGIQTDNVAASTPETSSDPVAEEINSHSELSSVQIRSASTVPKMESLHADPPDPASAEKEVVPTAFFPESVSAAAKKQNDEDQYSLTLVDEQNRTEVPQRREVSRIQAETTTHPVAVRKPIVTVKKTMYLKNARVDEPYSSEVKMAGISGIRHLDLGESGLEFEPETATLSGTPVRSGDFTLLFRGLLDSRQCDITANLAVIPDPKSLWVAKETDRNARYWKEDEDHGLSRGDLLCVAASKRGRSHAQEGLFRDDDFSLWTGEPMGWNIAAVADGAGSAKFSRQGSRIAVRTITKELPMLLEEHLTGPFDGLVSEWLNGVQGAENRIREQLYRSLAKAAFSAAKAISAEARKAEERASAFSTTLVMSVARKVLHGWFIAGFSIGDGGAAVLDLPSRTAIPLSSADSGEFAGQTRFLQSSEFSNAEAIMNRIFFHFSEEFTAILAMTDGITDPKFPTDAAFESPEIWARFWEEDLSPSVGLRRDNPKLEQELLAWLDFWSPGNHDDRTLAIMLP